MIVETMSPLEIQAEIEKDLKEVIAFSEIKDKSYRRAVLKTTKFPVYFSPINKTTKLKNRWILFYVAKSKKDIKESRVSFVCLMDTKKGIYAFMPTFTNGNFHIVIYQPHFFSRFRERTVRKEIGVELISSYFKLNYSYVYELKKKFIDKEHFITEVYGSSAEGVALGVMTENNHVLFRTFITYNMLKGEQIKVFTENEKIRREIYQNE